MLGARIELARVAPHAPQTCASTSSAIRACHMDSPSGLNAIITASPLHRCAGGGGGIVLASGEALAAAPLVAGLAEAGGLAEAVGAAGGVGEGAVAGLEAGDG